MLFSSNHLKPRDLYSVDIKALVLGRQKTTQYIILGKTKTYICPNACAAIRVGYAAYYRPPITLGFCWSAKVYSHQRKMQYHFPATFLLSQYSFPATYRFPGAVFLLYIVYWNSFPVIYSFPGIIILAIYCFIFIVFRPSLQTVQVFLQGMCLYYWPNSAGDSDDISKSKALLKVQLNYFLCSQSVKNIEMEEFWNLPNLAKRGFIERKSLISTGCL